MRKIISYIKPYFGMMAIGLTVKMTATFAELAIPRIMTYIIDIIVPRAEVRFIVIWGLVMLACAVAAVILNIIANRRAAKVARNVAEAVRRDLFRKTMHLSAAQSDKFTVPSLEARLTTDTYNVHHFINIMQRMGVRAPLMLIGGITITLTIDPVLTLVMVCMLPLIALTVYFVSKRGVPLYVSVQKKVDRMVGVVREDAQGIRVIKALSKRRHEQERYDAVNEELASTEKKAGVTMALSNPLMTLFMNLGLVGVIIVGAFRVNSGISTAGNILAFIQYFNLISMAMMSVTRMFVMYTKGSASAKRITEVIESGEDLTVRDDIEPEDAKDSFIEFRDVSFSYGKTKNDLSNISFKVRQGGSLGIIGATGSGKTTLISLLMRFYDVDSGVILIDGKDVRSMRPGELHSKFGVALQNDFLYNATIAENIDFGRNLSEEELIRAAKMAQAHDFISAFDDGYSHEIASKGTNLSGGQKQRLLISRALAGRPEILILDDSSSALDYKTDSALRRAIAESDLSTTMIVIAQRVSSVMNMDTIIVLDEGQIIGMGTHQELIEGCEIYREISESQLGGAILE